MITIRNLQNIPSKNKDIRKMFKATEGYVMMSSDFSQQEIKVMAQMCQDPDMIESFKQGKDFYAQIASVSFGYPYEECLEHRPDGSVNKEGKVRRSNAKSILLGINYGRGSASIAEQLGTTVERAESIKQSVFNGFPAIKQFESDSIGMAKERGYVTTLWGRKRRLPDMQLPDYEFEYIRKSNMDGYREVPYDIANKWYKKMMSARSRYTKRQLVEQAKAEGINIIMNTDKIADATRQCVNARIQGSASDMSKLAMIAVGTNKRLKELGFRLLIAVHDELIGECPEENREECEQLFSSLMSNCGGEMFTIPISCDVETTKVWYGEPL